MARLIIKKYKNTNDKSAAFGKTYGRLVHQDTMNTSDLCRHMMKHGTIYTSDIVKGVVEKFINCFEELLLEGNKIKLDGLGTFYLSANTEGVADEKDFSANNVKAIHVRFLPDQSKESEYTAKMLTSKARFRSLAGEEMPKDEGGENNGENGNG